MKQFRGIFVPIVTPLTSGDTLNVPVLHEHIDVLIDAGVHGLIPGGSTGEVISLSVDEYGELLRETIQRVAGRVPVVAGCSANSTRDVIRNIRQAETLGADGVMLVHPFYSLPDEREVDLHYEQVAASTNLPVMVYNNPVTSGVDTKPPQLAKLAALPNIEYVKESSGDASRIIDLIELSERRLKVFCGTDNQALENFAVGAVGWVAGVANAIPEQCVALYNLAVVERRIDDALSLYREILPFLTLAETTGKFVQVNKAAVRLQGRAVGLPRAPLQDLEEGLLEQVKVALSRAKAAAPAS